MGRFLLLLCFIAFVRCQTTTLYNQADVAALLLKSPDVEGNVVIASSFTGVANLDGLETIEYGLYCENATALTKLSSSTLVDVGLNMVLRNLSALSTIYLPKLTGVYSLDWWELPALDTVEIKSNTSEYHTASHGANSNKTGMDWILFVHIGKSFMSNLDFFIPPQLRSLSLYRNFRLQTLNLSKLQWIENITIIGNDNLRTIDLGNTSTADFIKIDGDFDEIRGLKNITIKRHFSLKTNTPHDCAQYSRMGEADIHCISPNSTFHRSHPELLVWDGIVHTDFLSFPDLNSTVSAPPPGDPIKPSSSIGTPFIATVAVLSALLLGIIVFLCTCLWRRRRAKQKRASTNPNMLELPLNQCIPKVELAVDERPGKLFMTTGKSSSTQHRASELSAHIIHVNEVEPQLYVDGVASETGEGILPVEVSVKERLREGEEQKLEVLKTRLDNVRVERERLGRMQELEELEKSLQEEVMAKHRSVAERDP